ncbi:hypothetical protein CCHR01_19633 [Colletotrichum chrysophilum]|uniref:Uncharacterized protein n=1 Tax=Colletotrichum chrysophilum TaxID=1836956 RepID=A0AAD8ZXY8_9PEZI|nr:hypothetical protein CCHR01_19633 [Colletotrichum chrysophilum]
MASPAITSDARTSLNKPFGDLTRLAPQNLSMVLHGLHEESSLAPLMRTKRSFWAAGKAIV